MNDHTEKSVLNRRSRSPSKKRKQTKKSIKTTNVPLSPFRGSAPVGVGKWWARGFPAICHIRETFGHNSSAFLIMSAANATETSVTNAIESVCCRPCRKGGGGGLYHRNPTSGVSVLFSSLANPTWLLKRKTRV